MRVLTLDEIKGVATRERVIEVVRGALIAHSEGRTQVPPPVHLVFADADGDAHVKAGHLLRAKTFSVKLATGFYGNRRLGLPSNHGLVVVSSAETGEVAAVLDDQGWLTAWRTAAAASLATDALARPGPIALAVLGTGLQARLAVDWHRALRSLRRVLIAGRRPEAAAELAREVGGEATESPAAAVNKADAVLTATAARAPLFEAAVVRPGTHITALGADLAGKQELPVELLSRATLFADDLDQSLDHGDLGHGLRAGALARGEVHLLGDVLRDGLERADDAITVADLTGVGALDAAVADAVVEDLSVVISTVRDR
jgi:ornithine cyclodeaminase/alanine dehydrogenase-like protein (mu-crystallin family)